jgi:hypothetical protein
VVCYFLRGNREVVSSSKWFTLVKIGGKSPMRVVLYLELLNNWCAY